jgi:hypothetical protein
MQGFPNKEISKPAIHDKECSVRSSENIDKWRVWTRLPAHDTQTLTSDACELGFQHTTDIDKWCMWTRLPSHDRQTLTSDACELGFQHTTDKHCQCCPKRKAWRKLWGGWVKFKWPLQTMSQHKHQLRKKKSKVICEVPWL